MQQDIKIIGDSQNPQWWGAKQGLFINALANQYGQFTSDLTFQNTINQNTIFSIESTHNGGCTFSNSITGAPLMNTTGLRYASGNVTPYGINLYFLGFLVDGGPLSSRENAIISTFNFKASKLEYTHINYNGDIFFTPTPNFNAYNLYIKRIKNVNSAGFTFGAGDITNVDNFYINNVFRLNQMHVGNVNYFNTGVIHSLRIYTRILDSAEITANYHSMTATNTANLFCEWKMSQLSDFYTFGGNLYARNTGTSGNGLDIGTGYDMQLIGYPSNIPILQSIY